MVLFKNSDTLLTEATLHSCTNKRYEFDDRPADRIVGLRCLGCGKTFHSPVRKPRERLGRHPLARSWAHSPGRQDALMFLNEDFPWLFSQPPPETLEEAVQRVRPWVGTLDGEAAVDKAERLAAMMTNMMNDQWRLRRWAKELPAKWVGVANYIFQKAIEANRLVVWDFLNED